MSGAGLSLRELRLKNCARMNDVVLDVLAAALTVRYHEHNLRLEQWIPAWSRSSSGSIANAVSSSSSSSAAVLPSSTSALTPRSRNDTVGFTGSSWMSNALSLLEIGENSWSGPAIFGVLAANAAAGCVRGLTRAYTAPTAPHTLVEFNCSENIRATDEVLLALAVYAPTCQTVIAAKCSAFTGTIALVFSCRASDRAVLCCSFSPAHHGYVADSPFSDVVCTVLQGTHLHSWATFHP